MEALVAETPEPARSLLRALRAAVLAFGGVTERRIVDYDATEESPAFYVGARQLCHVHVGTDGIEVTIALSRGLTLEVIRAADVPQAVRDVVGRTKEYGATRWVSLTVAGDADLPGVIALSRHKHRFLAEGGGPADLAMPRDQTTLEKFV